LVGFPSGAGWFAGPEATPLGVALGHLGGEGESAQPFDLWSQLGAGGASDEAGQRLVAEFGQSFGTDGGLA
jgi:hypothetical protein